MTRRALLLGILLLAIPACAEDTRSGARLLDSRQGVYGRTDTYLMPGGSVRRLWIPVPGIYARPRWLEPWEVPPG